MFINHGRDSLITLGLGDNWNDYFWYLVNKNQTITSGLITISVSREIISNKKIF